MQMEQYRKLMRNHVGAPVVIATGKRGARTGLTATAFCSVSDSPPTVLICVNKNASAHPQIEDTQTFSVNLLHGDQEEIARKFAGQTGLKGEQRFDEQWSISVTGAPVLDSALASLDCEVAHAHDYGSHSIFIGRVRDMRTSDDGNPLVYFRGNFNVLP